MLLLPKTRASRAQPKAPPREARAMAICPSPSKGLWGWRWVERWGEWWVRARKGTGRVPEDRFRSPQMSRKSKSGCVRVSACVCMCSIYVCECVGLAVRKKNCKALLSCFLSLSYLHSLGVQSFACAVLLRRLNTSPPPSVSLSPPTLPPSLCLSFALTPASRVLYALYETASLLSLIQLFSPPSSLPVYHSAFLLNLFLPPSLPPFSLPLTNPLCYSMLLSCIPPPETLTVLSLCIC